MENIGNELNVMEKDAFEVDKKYMYDDFYADHYKEKLKWFCKNFLDTHKEIQEEFYRFVYKYKIHIFC